VFSYIRKFNPDHNTDFFFFFSEFVKGYVILQR